MISLPERFVNVKLVPIFLYAELFVPKLSIPIAPSSLTISELSVVYHSAAVQFASLGLHSYVAVTPEPSHAVAVNVTFPAALNVIFLYKD